MAGSRQEGTRTGIPVITPGAINCDETSRFRSSVIKIIWTVCVCTSDSPSTHSSFYCPSTVQKYNCQSLHVTHSLACLPVTTPADTLWGTSASLSPQASVRSHSFIQ